MKWTEQHELNTFRIPKCNVSKSRSLKWTHCSSRPITHSSTMSYQLCWKREQRKPQRVTCFFPVSENFMYILITEHDSHSFVKEHRNRDVLVRRGLSSLQYPPGKTEVAPSFLPLQIKCLSRRHWHSSPPSRQKSATRLPLSDLQCRRNWNPGGRQCGTPPAARACQPPGVRKGRRSLRVGMRKPFSRGRLYSSATLSLASDYRKTMLNLLQWALAARHLQADGGHCLLFVFFSFLFYYSSY